MSSLTARVVSRNMTWVADGLPELTAETPVEIPLSDLPLALALQGVEQLPDPPTLPSELE